MGKQALNDTQDQSNVLSRKRTIVIFVTLALTLFISILDQTSVSTSLPVIAKELDAVSTISWVQPKAFLYLLYDTSLTNAYTGGNIVPHC